MQLVGTSKMRCVGKFIKFILVQFNKGLSALVLHFLFFNIFNHTKNYYVKIINYFPRDPL